MPSQIVQAAAGGTAGSPQTEHETWVSTHLVIAPELKSGKKPPESIGTVRSVVHHVLVPWIPVEQLEPIVAFDHFEGCEAN